MYSFTVIHCTVLQAGMTRESVHQIPRQSWLRHSLHRTLYTVHYTLYTVQYRTVLYSKVTGPSSTDRGKMDFGPRNALGYQPLLQLSFGFKQYFCRSASEQNHDAFFSSKFQNFCMKSDFKKRRRKRKEAKLYVYVYIYIYIYLNTFF